VVVKGPSSSHQPSVLERSAGCVSDRMCGVVRALSQGLPFRETHHVSGAAVRLAEDRGVPLSSLTPDDLRTLHPLFADDVAQVWSYETSVERKNAAGGTARSAVLAQIESVRGAVASLTKA
jgi:argininosuccinate lyase